MTELCGITWNHTRGYVPMEAAAQRFSELNPEIHVRWEKRSLQRFADAPIEDLAARYDLLVVDHPSSGSAAASQALLPLEEHLPGKFLSNQAENSVGASHRSYFYGGHQWALAIDAATPVSGWRPDLLDKAGAAVPETWPELLDLARRGLVILPAIPIDSLMNFNMLCCGLGEDPYLSAGVVASEEVGITALTMLRELVSLCPADCLSWNPIAIWETLSSTDTAALCPFAYGYSNYARAGYSQNVLKFGGLVRVDERCRSTLGGAGLAVSALRRNAAQAMDYCRFVAGPGCQSGIYFDSGGQPGHRAAWLNERINNSCGNFFLDTLPTLDAAYVRPRWNNYISFQEEAAAVVHGYLKNGGDAKAALNEMNDRMGRFAVAPELRGGRMKPLDGMLVLDFSQFLAGPSAALRLADLGARVIKIERPGSGDLCRQLYISNLELDGESTLFHSINRNKQSFAANLKDPQDAEKVWELVRKADVMIQNFRPGVMEKLGFHYEAASAVNSKLVYAEVTGYGKEGPWRNKPGQDLLLQALSGLAWLNGNADQPPVPFGLAVADLFAGAHLTQGILACLVRRGVTGQGGRVEVSLLESILDAQFEVLTTYLNDGGKLPERSRLNNAHAYLGAPYGIYETADGHIALAMGPLMRLVELLDCQGLGAYADPSTWFEHRDEIKHVLSEHLKTRPTSDWLGILEPADIWCADVLSWPQLMEHEAFQAIDMIQEVPCQGGSTLRTTRCPVRIDGEIYKSPLRAPAVGEHTSEIVEEFATGSAEQSK